MKRDGPDPAPPDAPDPLERAVVTWAEASHLFARALEVPPDQRLAWLAGLDGIDEGTRDEVASLLRANAAAGKFLIDDGDA